MLKSIFGYFLALFFSKSVLLTPAPIDLDARERVVNSPEPLNILDERAALYVHLANITKDEFGQIIVNKMQYPGADKINASMCDNSDKCIPLAYEGLALQEHSVEAVYRADWSGRGKIEFSSVRISSDVSFHAVSLRWANSNK